MDRVWGLNATSTVPTKPSTLEVGYPRSSGIATTPGYWWYYLVTETLRNPIVNAGLTPSADALDQLTQAIEIIAARTSITGSLLPVKYVDTVGVTLNGVQTIDGSTTGDGDRVMRNLNAGSGGSSFNGIWITSTTGAWTRASEMSTGDHPVDGTLVEVGSGAAGANTLWMLNGPSTITIATTPIFFVEVTAGIRALLTGYLTTATAASTYLTQSTAALTYARLDDVADFITSADVAATYLTKAAAIATYATIAQLSVYATSTAVAATYATQTSLSNYETSAHAATTYLSKTDAALALKAGNSVEELITASGRTSSPGNPWVFRVAMFDLIFPVESIIVRFDNVNPSTLYQGTSWSLISGGHVLVGWNGGGGDADFATLGVFGGAKTTTLTESNIPKLPYRDRYYAEAGTAAEMASVTNKEAIPGGTSYNAGVGSQLTDNDNNTFVYFDTFTSNSPSGATAYNQMNPYLVVAFWRRTA